MSMWPCGHVVNRQKCHVRAVRRRATAPAVTQSSLDLIRITAYTNIVTLEVHVRDAAQFFKVLADEARLKMLWLLFNQQELCVCDIMAALDITQSKASRHLSTLRHADLVIDRKDGLWSYYALRPAEDALAREHLKLLKASLGRMPDAALLLTRLQTCLQAKKSGSGCVQNGTRAALKNTCKRTGKAPAQGASK
jgi:ArsR family transcriptional regulator, arsenate/arsenite/antimonite-responsive transcriptional repressor